MKEWWQRHNVQLLIVFYHFVFVWSLFHFNVTWQLFVGMHIVAVLYAWLIGSEVAHLYFAHTRYQDSLKNRLYTFLVLLGGLGSPLSFSALHRLHHKYTDTDKDPHSPTHLRWWKVYFLFWKVDRINPSIIKDFIASKFQMFVHNNSILLHFAMVIPIVILAPISVLFISYAVLYTFHIAGIINVRGHAYGAPRNAIENFVIQFWGWRHGDHHNVKNY